MTRRSGGTTCPRCKQYASLIDNGCRLGEHKTKFYLPGQPATGRRRERCRYSGGLVTDAAAGITPNRRAALSTPPDTEETTT